MDNATAMFYVNKQGDTGSLRLCAEALRIWHLAIEHDMHLTSIHIAGSLNTLADTLSRQSLNILEGTLPMHVLEPIFEVWGFPDVDLFATSQNTRRRSFCSRAAVGEGSLGNAFQLVWHGTLFYAFPPLSLLHRVLGKLCADQSSCILIAPYWPTRTWFPILWHLSHGTHQFLPDQVSLCLEGQLNSLCWELLHLAVWWILP